MSTPPAYHNEIAELVESLCQGELTPEQTTRLEELLCTDKQSRQYYVRYLHLHASLPMFSRSESGKQELARLQQLLSAAGRGVTPDGQEGCPLSSLPKEGTDTSSGVLGFIGECFQQGASFLSKPGIFSLLVAIGLPGIILLMLVMSLVQQTPPDKPNAVATVVRTHDCTGCLGDGHTWLLAGMDLNAGERLTLRKGLAEIEFVDGARVIIEAPTAFEIRHTNGGFLQMGRLTANVPTSAHGFTVETPLANIVDLGTDFGVLVATDGTAEAHVFTGEIEVATKTMPENPTSLTKRFHVGQAARIEVPNALQATASIESMPAVSDKFVQSFPTSLPKDTPVQKDLDKNDASLIASVDRHGGATGNRVPIGAFDGDSDPLKSDVSGLHMQSPIFSDRMYVIDDMSPELAGTDYIRTFLSDKFYLKEGYPHHDYSYDVTFSPNRKKVFLLVLVDNRFERGGGEQQAAVDQIVSDFASPGEFVNTGLYIDGTDSHNSHPLTAFGKWVPTADSLGKPITYTFHAAPNGKSSFIIAAMADEPTAPRINTKSKPKK